MKDKEIKGYAVVNAELGVICLTGHLDNDPVSPNLVDVGKAIFDTRAEAVEYRKTFLPKAFVKVVPVLIKPLPELGGTYTATTDYMKCPKCKHIFKNK